MYNNKMGYFGCNKAGMEDLLKKIKKEGEHAGCNFIVQKTMGHDTYVVANLKSSKGILVGQTKGGIIKFYEVNVKKWKWAESEGFSADNMVSDLFDEIFVKIEVDLPVSSYDISTKIIKKLK